MVCIARSRRDEARYCRAPHISETPHMPADILTLLEQDCAPEVAQAFLTLATDYLAATHDRNLRVSTDATRGQLARRFAEPLPSTGRPVAEIVARLRDQVIPDCNHL